MSLLSLEEGRCPGNGYGEEKYPKNVLRTTVVLLYSTFREDRPVRDRVTGQQK